MFLKLNKKPLTIAPVLPPVNLEREWQLSVHKQLYDAREAVLQDVLAQLRKRYPKATRSDLWLENSDYYEKVYYRSLHVGNGEYQAVVPVHLNWQSKYIFKCVYKFTPVQALVDAGQG